MGILIGIVCSFLLSPGRSFIGFVSKFRAREAYPKVGSFYFYLTWAESHDFLIENHIRGGGTLLRSFKVLAEFRTGVGDHLPSPYGAKFVTGVGAHFPFAQGARQECAQGARQE